MTPRSRYNHAVLAVCRTARDVRDYPAGASCKILWDQAYWSSNSQAFANDVAGAYRLHSGARRREPGFAPIPGLVWWLLPRSVKRAIRLKKLHAFLGALIRGEVQL